MRSFFLFLFCFPLIVLGQDQLRIKKSASPITVDGDMTEAAWQAAEVATDFQQFYPNDDVKAKMQTEVRLTYDADFLYVFAIMHNNGPRNYVTPSLRRDFRGEANDTFVIQLDTYQDKTNSFQFGTNPYGVQREGLVANGGSDNFSFSLDWDNKWFSAAKMLENSWVCELAIPFKSIRYKSGLSAWNVNFYRIDSHETERSTWAPIPRNMPLISLAFSKPLIWDEPLKKSDANISLIPYIAETGSKDYVEDYARNKIEVGLDAKIGITSALNLDVTINPNFSQVEVDQQVTNLDRFEIFFPEKRQFFLENADLFSGFGTFGAQPFFSRRIGVARDETTGQNINNPIYAGIRLSGKINNDWRVGALSMQAGSDKEVDLPTTNYSVAAIQRKLFTRSNISAIVVHKQAFQDSVRGDFTWRPQRHNTVVGLDYNHASANGKFASKFYYHHAFSPNPALQDSAYSTGIDMGYTSRPFDFGLLARTVGNDFNPEVGFVRRTRFSQVAPEMYFWVYPKSDLINKHGPGVDVDYIYSDLYGATDWDANIWYQVRFQSTANASIRLRKDYVYLFNEFDPSGKGEKPLPDSIGYSWYNVVYRYQSDARKKVFFTIGGRTGQYYNGTRVNAEGTLSFRIQPKAVLSLDYSFNKINLPKPYSSSTLYVLGTKWDFTFRRNLFWTTYVQYNNQNQIWNINSRLQWRFLPVSDLFIVYTDSYFAEDTYVPEADGVGGVTYRSGQPKLRSLAIKATIWLNP